MNPKHDIRHLEPRDRGRWDVLWAGYLHFYQTTLASEVSDAAFARLIDPDEPMFGLVAEADDGALHGFAHCVLHRGTWSLSDVCYLEDLYVAPEARGHGLGRALIEAVYREADARGVDHVYWLTHETNADARALYDRIAKRSGFIQYRRD